MSPETPDGARRFTRMPRAAADADPREIAKVKFRDSLDAIEMLLHHATSGGRAAFTRNSPAYASGSMVVIRTAALFETAEFDEYLRDVPDEVVRGITTMRHIASHSGYRSMNDDLFWTTITVELPPHLTSWRAATER